MVGLLFFCVGYIVVVHLWAAVEYIKCFNPTPQKHRERQQESVR